MPLAKLDAAALGLPGRMMMVGGRAARPSTKPLRVYSLINSSPMDLVMP